MYREVYKYCTPLKTMFEMKINGSGMRVRCSPCQCACVWRWTRVQVLLWLAVAVVLLMRLYWRLFGQLVVDHGDGHGLVD